MSGSYQSGNLALNIIAPPVQREQAVVTHSMDGLLLPEPRISSLYLVAKRSLDIVGALIALGLFSLLFPVIALLILWEDRGPIFYKQERIGRHGRPFTIYKLRSMITDADVYLARHPELLQAWQQTGKLHADPRITRIGSFLRRSSIDELPQLFNVLRGEMSLVGPRAIQPSELAAFGELSELRQMVKPGLTGLWQVSGRSTTDYEQRCILDCTYVMECSLQMDIQILFRTLPVVFHRTGAY